MTRLNSSVARSHSICDRGSTWEITLDCEPDRSPAVEIKRLQCTFRPVGFNRGDGIWARVFNFQVWLVKMLYIDDGVFWTLRVYGLEHLKILIDYYYYSIRASFFLFPFFFLSGPFLFSLNSFYSFSTSSPDSRFALGPTPQWQLCPMQPGNGI